MTRRSHASTTPTGSAVDALFEGKVRLAQPARGYRVNVDALLLAHFAVSQRPRARCLVDLGSGVGGVTLAYAHWGSAARAELVEQQADLVDLAGRNLADNRVAGSVHHANLTEGLPRALRGVADVVVSNPPYFAHGNTPSRPSRAHARHGDVDTFLQAAAIAMGRRARAFFIYPASDLPALLVSARAAGLVPKVMQLVHAFEDAPARVVLVDFRRAKPGGLVILPPILEWAGKGARTALLSRLTSGRR